MDWLYPLGAALAVCLAIGAAILFAPLRIFVHYLRKNRNDQITITIKLLCCGFSIGAVRSAAFNLVTMRIILGRWSIRLPGPERIVSLIERLAERRTARISRRMKEERNWAALSAGKLLEAFKEIKPQLKKVSWHRFDLEVIFGLDDPALAGLAAGGGWVIGGVMLGLMYRIFSIKTRPRFKIEPRFCAGNLQLHWNSEAALPLFRCLKIAFISRKKILEVL